MNKLNWDAARQKAEEQLERLKHSIEASPGYALGAALAAGLFLGLIVKRR